MLQRNKYVEHVYVKRSYLKRQISFASVGSNNSVVLQLDYAENYTCWYQDAPQQANYGYNQISILTAAFWYSQNEPRTFGKVSDHIKHDEEAILTCLDLLFNKMPHLIGHIEIFSENAVSKFKNKFIFHALMKLTEKHKKNVTWNFLAVQHGKGVCDGVGAAIKSLLLTKSSQNRFK